MTLINEQEQKQSDICEAVTPCVHFLTCHTFSNMRTFQFIIMGVKLGMRLEYIGTKFQYENLNGRVHLKDLKVGDMTI
jgi:hypothetical protein